VRIIWLFSFAPIKTAQVLESHSGGRASGKKVRDPHVPTKMFLKGTAGVVLKAARLVFISGSAVLKPVELEDFNCSLFDCLVPKAV
jgi:hypothetical protein